MGTFAVRRPHDDVAVVVLLGEHDLATRVELDDLLLETIEGHAVVVVDVSCAEYVDSSVLNALVTADQRLQERGRRLALLVGTTAIVERALQLSGLLRMVPHALSEDEAVRLARGGDGRGG